MKITVAVIAVSVTLLSACTPTAEYPADKPKQIKIMQGFSANEACSEYNSMQLYYTKASLEPLLQIAIKAGAVRGKHANTIRESKIQIGMNETEVICSWGRPDNINTSTYSFGIHKQYVYGYGNYAYFENGKLTAIQN